MFFFLAHLVLLIAAVADCLGGEEQPRRFGRALWVLIIVLLPVAGGALWFTHGRPRRPGGNSGPTRRRPGPTPVAPDDDPEFLADLERRLRDQDH